MQEKNLYYKFIKIINFLASLPSEADPLLLKIALKTFMNVQKILFVSLLKNLQSIPECLPLVDKIQYQSCLKTSKLGH